MCNDLENFQCELLTQTLNVPHRVDKLTCACPLSLSNNIYKDYDLFSFCKIHG